MRAISLVLAGLVWLAPRLADAEDVLWTEAGTWLGQDPAILLYTPCDAEFSGDRLVSGREVSVLDLPPEGMCAKQVIVVLPKVDTAEGFESPFFWNRLKSPVWVRAETQEGRLIIHIRPLQP